MRAPEKFLTGNASVIPKNISFQAKMLHVICANCTSYDCAQALALHVNHLMLLIIIACAVGSRGRI